MKRYCILISLALFIGLFIYLVFRTERTEINILMNELSNGMARNIRLALRKSVPLPGFVIYSLPEGLWVFAATLVSRRLYVHWKRFRLQLAWLPLCYAVLLEFLQLCHFMPGRFDIADLLLSAGFALSALWCVPCPLPPQHLFRRLNYRTFSLVYIYAIVFLSHVRIAH